MVYPMMVGVDPSSLRDVVKQPKGLATSVDTDRRQEFHSQISFEWLLSLSRNKSLDP